MKSGEKGVRKNAYRMHPGGRQELVWVDPVYMTILDDVEEVESMLNSGYKVYADRDMMEKSWKEKNNTMKEKSWKEKNNTMNRNGTELKEKELKERLELLELMLVAMNIVVQGHNGIIAKLANEVEKLGNKVDLLEKEKV